MAEMADSKDVVGVLNGLIETNKDAEEGFRLASDKVKDLSLKSLFMRYSLQRSANVSELQDLVTGLGEKPASTGHIAASLHRGWMNLKEALSRDEDKAIIHECESGEKAALANYRDAFGKRMPADLHSIIKRQFSGINEARRVIRDMKRITEPAARSRFVRSEP